MKRYEFHSRLSPEEFLNDLREWAPIAGITCKIGHRRNRIKLWSKHTTFDRGNPSTLFLGRIYPDEDGSCLRGYYRPAISALIFNAVFVIWSTILSGIKGAVFSVSVILLMICIDLWDNASERRRVVRILRERYP